jgi:hypothetical protein
MISPTIDAIENSLTLQESLKDIQSSAVKREEPYRGEPYRGHPIVRTKDTRPRQLTAINSVASKLPA